MTNNNLLNFKLGHYTDLEACTGCTVLVFEDGAPCAVDVRGGAPGTRETDLLEPGMLVQGIHAILLTGGSAFGLDAASGVMNELEKRGIGFKTPDAVVPIVPAAVIYDLGVGNSTIRPDFTSGQKAVENALDNVTDALSTGTIGAGTGATVGKILGIENAMKSGLGSAIIQSGDTWVYALAVVNAVGSIVDENGKVIAGPKCPETGAILSTEDILLNGINSSSPLQNTTIGVIVTNARLTKSELKRLCIAGHDAYASVIKPVHTTSDGDTVFAVSSGDEEENLDKLMVMSAAVMREAIKNSIK